MQFVPSRLEGNRSLMGGIARAIASLGDLARHSIAPPVTCTGRRGALPPAPIEVLEGRTLLSAGGDHITVDALHDQAVVIDHDGDKHQCDRDARHFKAHLSGEEEVPPRETPAKGEAEFELSEDGTQLFFKLEVEDIENVVGAHLHLGAPGVNGPIVVGLYSASPGGGPVDGVLASGIITSEDLTGPLAGMTLSDLINEIKANNIYVNVHTDDGIDPPDTGPGDFPAGEIRGQVTVRDDRKDRDDDDHKDRDDKKHRKEHKRRKDKDHEDRKDHKDYWDHKDDKDRKGEKDRKGRRGKHEDRHDDDQKSHGRHDKHAEDDKRHDRKRSRLRSDYEGAY